jgi:hypothetical protein
MVPRLIVLWLAASSPAWAEREERYLVKPTTEVSAVNTTDLPLSFAANPLGTDAGDLVSGDSSVHPVSQSFVTFLLNSAGHFINDECQSLKTLNCTFFGHTVLGRIDSNTIRFDEELHSLIPRWYQAYTSQDVLINYYGHFLYYRYMYDGSF